MRSWRRAWGPNLRRARERAGVTQEHLALLVDRTQTTVHRWETNVIVPDDDMKVRLAVLLHTTVADMFPTPGPADVDDDDEESAAEAIGS